MTRIPIRAVAALAAAAVAAAPAVAAFVPGAAQASHAPESMFQDDDHLIYADSDTVAHALDVLKGLGVNRIRLTIEWKALAPNATSSTEPAGFDATNPADYTSSDLGGSADVWAPYDRVVGMAAARGIAVNFNVAPPGPLWAMQPAPVTTQFGTRPADHYDPSATDFGQFVQALGTRYSGTYVPPPSAPPTTTTPTPPPITIPLLTPPGPTSTTTTPTDTGTALPRVDYWSIGNEPNQPGWLAPQWRTVGGRRVPDSPRLYRSLVRAGVGALDATGHTLSSDTILVGETAPEGAVTAVKVAGQERYRSATGFYQAMTPMVFLRALYCVNSSYRRLTGAAATALGCPSSGSAHAFVTENPGLFYATGFAHHPYYFNYAPNYSSPVADYVPLANLGRLERGLDRTFATYGVNRRIPIYLTEYGYQTNPPDPYQVVSPAKQATYLNEADYIAWRYPRVRSVAQFLLYDAGPDAKYPASSFNYWDTFQTGLVYGPGSRLDGRQKPAYAAYRLPIWIPAPHVRRGSKMLIWGMLRLAPANTAQRALIRWRPARGRDGYRTISTVSVPASARYGYFTTRVRPPGTGSIRIAWRSGAGETFASRVVPVRVG
jgi:hypothetical protein